MDISTYNIKLKRYKFIIIKSIIVMNLLFWGFLTYNLIRYNATSYILFKFFNMEALKNINTQPASISGKMANGNTYYFTSDKLKNYLEGFINKTDINFEGVSGGIKTPSDNIELIGKKAVFNQSTKEFILTQNVKLSSNNYSINLQNIILNTISNQVYSSSYTTGSYGTLKFSSQGFLIDNNFNNLTLIGPIQIDIKEKKQ
jgi:hypothetical protein